MDVEPDVWTRFTDFLLFDKGLRDRSIYAYCNTLRNIFAYMTQHGETMLTYANMHRYLHTLADAGCAYSTLSKRKTTLRHWLEFNNSALSVPDVRCVKQTQRRMLYLSYQQIEVILANIPDTPLGILDRAVIDLAYSSGMRRDEICQLRQSDIRWGERIIYVRNGKGGKERLVPFGEATMENLQQYWWQERSQYAVKGWLARNQFFVTPQRHRPLTGNWMQKLNDRINRHYSPFTQRITLHDFRRAFATHMMENGEGEPFLLDTVQLMLGHANPGTTAHYIRYGERQLEKIFARHHPRAGDDEQWRKWWFRDHIPEKEFYEEEKAGAQKKAGKKRKKGDKNGQDS